MKLVVVGHQMPNTTVQAAQVWAQSLNASLWCVDTAESNNEYFEFSGYQTALDRLLVEPESYSFPVLLVNDTVFTKRWTAGWLSVFKCLQTIPLRSGGMYADVRRLTKDYRYVSSWLYFCSDASSVQTLHDALQKVELLAKKKELNNSPEVTALLSTFLHPSNGWSGYAGELNESSRKRKEQTIRWEHAVSERIISKIDPFPWGLHLWSLVVWNVDRFLQRWKWIARKL